MAFMPRQHLCADRRIYWLVVDAYVLENIDKQPEIRSFQRATYVINCSEHLASCNVVEHPYQLLLSLLAFATLALGLIFS